MRHRDHTKLLTENEKNNATHISNLMACKMTNIHKIFESTDQLEYIKMICHKEKDSPKISGPMLYCCFVHLFIKWVIPQNLLLF